MSPRKSNVVPKTAVAQVELAKHLDISQSRVAQFVKEGIFAPNAKSGRLPVDKSRIAYIRWLRDESRKSAASMSTRRVQDARAKEIELRIAREQNKLVEMDEVEAFLRDAVGSFRSELFGVPAACTRDLALRGVINQHLENAIDRIRAGFDATARQIRETGTFSEEDEE